MLRHRKQFLACVSSGIVACLPAAAEAADTKSTAQLSGSDLGELSISTSDLAVNKDLSVSDLEGLVQFSLEPDALLNAPSDKELSTVGSALSTDRVSFAPLLAEGLSTNSLMPPLLGMEGSPSDDQASTENLSSGPYLPNPFNLPIPLNRSPWDFSHKKHCDVLRHLKIPATYRRVDTYMRPEYMLPLPKDNSLARRDQLLSFKGRERLFEKGVDIYGCSNLDYLTDVVSNLSTNPIVRGTTGPWHNWQLNINQVLGVDLYSRLVSNSWKTGQIHLSFTWPEAGNLGPIYSYGNTLNPAGLGTRQYQGYFYTDVGRSRDVNTQMQGARLFEYWFDQRYGHKSMSYVRIGAIYPWITFNKSILAGLFGFWAFDEPGVIGTTPSTANGPLVTTAPPGISIEHHFNDYWIGKVMVGSGYWDPTGGLDNRRGTNQYWNLDLYGLETFYELTWRGGTYSGDSRDNGKPWFVRVGGQYHSGYGLNNAKDINGNYFFLTGQPREVYYGNSQYYAMVEAMLYREPGSYSRGLTGFLKAKYSPWDYKGSLTKQLTGGIGYEGIFGRDNDVLFLGYAHMGVNKGVIERTWNMPACTQLPNCAVANFQGAFEIGYSSQITPYFFINPKLYYILHPNTRMDLGDTLSFGIEFRLSL
jgi:carbohydrate-selective porin OprB